MIRHPEPARRRPAGFSLIEVLVSICVVSAGILALAALTQAATRQGKMSELRATATLLAADIADRLRANAAGAQLGPAGYDLGSRAWPSPLSAPHVPCTGAAPCVPADLARADLATWTLRLRATLPEGSAYLRYHPATSTANAGVDVWVGWTDPGTRPAGGTPERAADECPADWAGAPATVRCIALEVGV